MKFLYKWIPLPILVGIIASVLMYKIYGAHEFWKNFLSWIIGSTIISLWFMSLVGVSQSDK